MWQMNMLMLFQRYFHLKRLIINKVLWVGGELHSTLYILGVFCPGFSHAADKGCWQTAPRKDWLLDPSFISPDWEEQDLWPGSQRLNGSFVVSVARWHREAHSAERQPPPTMCNLRSEVTYTWDGVRHVGPAAVFMSCFMAEVNLMISGSLSLHELK